MPNHPLPTAGAAVFGHDKSKDESKPTAHARELAAAGDYVLGALADDEKRTEGALDQLDVVKLPALILDIACRAVAALAAERGISADDAMAMLVSGQ
jgi:hypothetical protein